MPTLLEDEDKGGNVAMSDRNRHMAKSAGRARRGSATSSALLLVVRLRCWGGHGGDHASSLSATRMLPPSSTSLSSIPLWTGVVVKIAASVDKEEERPH